MASTQFAMGLCVCAVLLIGILGVRADPTTELDCPSEFKSGSDNDVTYTVNSVGITNAQCFLASAVIFTYTPDGDTEGTQVCSHTYPPASCNDFDTSDTCGCTKQEGDVYTYKYTFPINEARLCGKIQAGLCQEPSGPFEEKVSSNCNTIRFADPTVSIVLIVIGQVMLVAASVLVIYFHIYRTDFPLADSGRNIAVTVCFVIVVVVMVIFDAIATHFACEEFPKESTCTPVCHACVPLTTADCAVVVIVVIIVLIKNLTSPLVTITSDPQGTSKENYTLTWTVTGCANILRFNISYEKVAGEGSGLLTPDGKKRSTTIQVLSPDSSYQGTITAVTTGPPGKGTHFQFKTAP